MAGYLLTLSAACWYPEPPLSKPSATNIKTTLIWHETCHARLINMYSPVPQYFLSLHRTFDISSIQKLQQTKTHGSKYTLTLAVSRQKRQNLLFTVSLAHFHAQNACQRTLLLSSLHTLKSTANKNHFWVFARTISRQNWATDAQNSFGAIW